MSVAVYPVLESEVKELEPHLMVGGKGIGSNIEVSEALAKSLNVASLMHFFSTNAEEVAGMMGLDDGEMPDFPVVEEWFNPATALVTIHSLRLYVQSHPKSVESPDWVLEDLDALTTTLTTAEQHGTRFHFSMNI